MSASRRDIDRLYQFSLVVGSSIQRSRGTLLAGADSREISKRTENGRRSRGRSTASRRVICPSSAWLMSMNT